MAGKLLNGVLNFFAAPDPAEVVRLAGGVSALRALARAEGTPTKLRWLGGSVDATDITDLRKRLLAEERRRQTEAG